MPVLVVLTETRPVVPTPMVRSCDPAEGAKRHKFRLTVEATRPDGWKAIE